MPENSKIGVVGYSSNRIDFVHAEQLLNLAFDSILSKNTSAQHIDIVSGLTNVGIPKVAYDIARKRGCRTVGISAEQAFKVHCGIYPVDKQMIHGVIFGDESELFVNYIDYLVRVRDGKQSHNEVQLFMAKCASSGWSTIEKLIEHELPILSYREL